MTTTRGKKGETGAQGDTATAKGKAAAAGTAEPPAGTPVDADPAHQLAAPAEGGAISNVAAPLTAPARRGPDGEPMAQHVAVGAVLDERHIGIVDEDGNPVDLATALVRGTAVGSIRRATQRIYEETTLPGSNQTRRKLLFGRNATVPEAVYEQIVDAAARTKSARAQAQAPADRVADKPGISRGEPAT